MATLSNGRASLFWIHSAGACVLCRSRLVLRLAEQSCVLLQATIAEMVRDEEEDAMRAAAVSGKDAPRSDTMYASFTSEEDDEAPSRSKGRRRRKGEPPRSRMGTPRRASRPGSTTASPVKVRRCFHVC